MPVLVTLPLMVVTPLLLMAKFCAAEEAPLLIEPLMVVLPEPIRFSVLAELALVLMAILPRVSRAPPAMLF